MLEFIYNPLAGSKKGAKVMAAIEKQLTERMIPFRSHRTEYHKHAIELAKQLTLEGATDIIAVGGDGTMNEVLNGIDPKTVNFGIIPAGSGNDFIVSCGIPNDALKALDIILNETPKPTDYMDCSGVRGINIIGTGIDVEILKRCASSKLWKGKLQYTLSLIISLIKFKFYEFDVLLRGKRESKDALIICIGNGKQFGGGIKICPNAVIDDGKLDFIIIRKMKRSKIPSAFIKLMKGKILEQSFTEYSIEDGVEICFDKTTTIQIDGELYEVPFAVKLIEKGINVYRP